MKQKAKKKFKQLLRVSSSDMGGGGVSVVVMKGKLIRRIKQLILYEPSHPWLSSYSITAEPCCILVITYSISLPEANFVTKSTAEHFQQLPFHLCTLKKCSTKVFMFYKLNFVICSLGWPSIHDHSFNIGNVWVLPSDFTCSQEFGPANKIQGSALQGSLTYKKNFEVLQMADGAYTMKNTTSFTQHWEKKQKRVIQK